MVCKNQAVNQVSVSAKCLCINLALTHLTCDRITCILKTSLDLQAVFLFVDIGLKEQSAIVIRWVNV